MEMCDSCNHPYDFTCNNEVGYFKRCYYCSPKQIQGCPKYSIYPDGRVWSSVRGKGVKGTGRFLKAYINCQGYYRVKINNSPTLIHRLIGIHYIPNPENKPCIDHINRDRTDNRICNLRWATHLENMNNIGMIKTNTSGHKYITYHRTNKNWRFNKTFHKQRFMKYFKSKIDCICYKYIILLKIKSFKKL